jgi:hypothetical protein
MANLFLVVYTIYQRFLFELCFTDLAKCQIHGLEGLFERIHAARAHNGQTPFGLHYLPLYFCFIFVLLTPPRAKHMASAGAAVAPSALDAPLRLACSFDVPACCILRYSFLVSSFSLLPIPFLFLFVPHTLSAPLHRAFSSKSRLLCCRP